MRKSIVSIVVLSAVSSSAFAANQTVNGVTQITTSQGAIAGFHVSGITGANYDLQKHEAQISALSAGKASVTQANQIAGVATANSAVIQNQGQKIQNLQGQVAATQSQLSSTWQQTGKNTQGVQQNAGQIAATQSQLSATFKQVGQNTQGIQQNTTNISNLTTQSGNFATKTDVATVDNKAEANHTAIVKTDKAVIVLADQERQDVKVLTKNQTVMHGDLVNHESRISGNESAIVKHGQVLANHEQRITNLEKRTTQRMDKVESDVKDVKRQVKAIGATATAAANLHYNRSESGYAVAVGEYEGATAIAGGMQFNISANTAATVQVSYDGEGAGASVGFHGSW